MINIIRSQWHYLKQTIKFKINWNGVDFSEVKSLVVFLGNPRSGTTLVRSIINAHPNAVISNEMHLLNQIRRNSSWRHAIINICNNVTNFSKNPIWTDYSYKIPNSIKKNKVLVIGDKRSAGTVTAIIDSPELLEKLIKWSPCPIKIIRCIRNPFDVISTRTFRNNQTLEYNIERYFLLEAAAESIAKQIGSPVFHIYNEGLIKNPKYTIENLQKFLNLKGNQEYINNCTSVINRIPNKSRNKITWTSEQIEIVNKESLKFNHLEFYLTNNVLEF